MSPILYAEFTCDKCGDIYLADEEDRNLAILRNGKILCESCAKKIPDQVFKWITVEKREEPELIPEEDRPEDPLAELDEALAKAEDEETDYELHKEENAKEEPEP